MIPSYATIGWLLTTTAIIGNGLVIYLIVATKHLQTSTNWFVLSLAAADFSFAVCFFPVAYFCEAAFTCDNVLRGIVSWQFATISIANLCAMAADRYIAIVIPFKYVRLMTTRRVFLLIGSAWGIPILLFLPPNLWMHFTGASQNVQLLFQVIYGAVFEILPCVFLVCATERILVISRRHYKQIAVVNAQLRFNQPSLRENRAQFSATVIILVVWLFILFYIMDVVGSICFYFDVCELSDEFHYVRKLLLIANSAANPFPYAFIKRDIKKEFKKMFKVNIESS
ncbi:adenosine receptor A2a-like [Oculina patagonica]